jgi:uncharacterized membrane protein YfcA
MNFYLPIAEISINIYLLISLGIGIGFISGLFGIGGGFITSPLLILVGIPPAVAVGTTTVQVFASTSTGVMSHYQKKNIDYQISFTMIIGGIFGTLTGVLLLNSLKNIGLIDNYLNSIYIVLLLGTALFILYETAKINLFHKNKKFKLHQHSWIHGLPIKIKYRKSKLYISILAPLSIGISNWYVNRTYWNWRGVYINPLYDLHFRNENYLCYRILSFKYYSCCINIIIFTNIY